MKVVRHTKFGYRDCTSPPKYSDELCPCRVVIDRPFSSSNSITSHRLTKGLVMSKVIPDLRVDHQEFTLEHCSVLLEQLVRFLKVIYGDDVSAIADQVDVQSMRD